MNTQQKLIGIAAGTALLTITGCKTLQEIAETRQVTPPEGVTLMTESELRETLVGNTYEGESVNYPGSTYLEYINPDGSIKGLWDGQDRYEGKWAISGKVWCYKYKNSSGCNTLVKKGDQIFWYNLDGSTRGGKAIVVSGDPNGLN